MLTRAEHKRLWACSWYVKLVEEKAAALGADGCTGVLDFYLLGCLEHDIAYRTHRDPLGNDLDKATADQRLRWYIQHRSPFGVVSPMSWWRWLGVKQFAQTAWDKFGRD